MSGYLLYDKLYDYRVGCRQKINHMYYRYTNNGKFKLKTILYYVSDCCHLSDTIYLFNLYISQKPDMKEIVVNRIFLSGIYRNYYEQVCWAISEGADIMASPTMPYHIGVGEAFYRSTDIARARCFKLLYRIQKGDFDNRLVSGMFFSACLNGNLRMCKFLRNNYVISEDLTQGLYNAIQSGNYMLIEWLIRQVGVDPKNCDKDELQYILDELCPATMLQKEHIVKLDMSKTLQVEEKEDPEKRALLDLPIVWYGIKKKIYDIDRQFLHIESKKKDKRIKHIALKNPWI